jgi:hypothetical protein
MVHPGTPVRARVYHTPYHDEKQGDIQIMSRRRKKFDVKNAALGVAVIALTGAALREQLRKPQEERTWEGRILGVPYDFRAPTPERIRERMWNPNTSSIFTPHIFGVGWTINFYPLVHPKTRNEAERELSRV